MSVRPNGCGVIWNVSRLVGGTIRFVGKQTATKYEYKFTQNSRVPPWNVIEMLKMEVGGFGCVAWWLQFTSEINETKPHKGRQKFHFDLFVVKAPRTMSLAMRWIRFSLFCRDFGAQAGKRPRPWLAAALNCNGMKTIRRWTHWSLNIVSKTLSNKQISAHQHQLRHTINFNLNRNQFPFTNIQNGEFDIQARPNVCPQ